MSEQICVPCRRSRRRIFQYSSIPDSCEPSHAFLEQVGIGVLRTSATSQGGSMVLRLSPGPGAGRNAPLPHPRPLLFPLPRPDSSSSALTQLASKVLKPLSAKTNMGGKTSGEHGFLLSSRLVEDKV